MSLTNNLVGAFNISLGCEAGIVNQKHDAIAIGTAAGHTNQGANSIAIGRLSAYSSQPPNSICLSASDDATIGCGATALPNSLYVSPIRTDPANLSYNLNYNVSTKEVTYALAQSQVGATGSQGAQGPSGSGAQGAQGPSGAAGDGLSNVYLFYNTSDQTLTVKALDGTVLRVI